MSFFAQTKYETPGVTILDNGKNFSLANFVGYTFVFETKGEVNGSVWGTDEYTHDSSLGAAAVHAGVLQAGRRGYVFMDVKPGIPFYRGSTRNGVTSSDWNNSGNSYVTLTFQSPSAAAQEAEDRPATADYLPCAVIQVCAASEASSDLFRRSVGHAICFKSPAQPRESSGAATRTPTIPRWLRPPSTPESFSRASKA